MSLEFTREAVMKFLALQFPCIDVDVDLRSNFIHLKIFNYLTKHREVLVKYSLHITQAGMLIHEFDTSYGNNQQIHILSKNQFIKRILWGSLDLP